MARDIFSREVSFGGAFSADGVRLTFSDTKGSPLTAFGCGMMVQQLSYQYAQNISRLYEIGCPDVYLVAGRTQGNAGINRVWGPRRLAADFYRQFGNVCKASANNIRFIATTGCDISSGEEQGMMLRNTVLQQVQGAIAQQDMIINDTMSLMFLALEPVGAST